MGLALLLCVCQSLPWVRGWPVCPWEAGVGAHPAASSQGASGKGSLAPSKRAEFPFREPSSSFLVGIGCSRSSLKVSSKWPAYNCTIIFRLLTDGAVLALPLGTVPVSRECSIITVTASALKCSRMWARMKLAHFEESWISFFLI